MGEKLDMVATLAVILAALAVAISALLRTPLMERTTADGAPQAGAVPPGARTDARLVFVDGWEALAEDGLTLGSSIGDVVVVEFTDFQCPFCRRFHESARALLEADAGVSLVLHHFPLTTHRWAVEAGVAVECAAAAGRLTEFVDAVFEGQDSFGATTWTAFAKGAGIQDTALFEDCLDSPEALQRVQRGRALGDSLGVTSTPTVIINGWRIVPPPYESLGPTIDSIRSGLGRFDSRSNRVGPPAEDGAPG